MHGAIEIEAASSEGAYDLLHDGLNMRTRTRKLDINEVEPELVED